MRGTVFVEGASAPRAVTLEVHADRVEATSEAGERWSVVLADASIEAGGFDGDHVFLRTPDGRLTVASQDAALVPALAAVADARVTERLAAVGLHRTRHARLRTAGIASVAVTVVLAVVGAAALVLWAPAMLSASVDALPITIDRQLGDAAEGELASAGAPLEDPLVVGFVEQVVARLEPHAATRGHTYRVSVVRSPQANAFALPGGRIVVFSGLIDAAERPEQVAGVLAHEMAHVTLRHGMRNVAHRAGLWLALSLLVGDSEGWVQLAGELALLARANDYSRAQETEADAEGVRMMLAAGLDARGLAAFFRALSAQPGTELAGALGWLSTHPDHASRIAHVERLVETLPAAAPRPLEVDWEAVRARAR
ncbi:MAG: M48 family metallopeptidase [Sandaracinaceae bacterium]|nr:M48 family metallopeptidase [Sandaracinaceae bacterium]